MAFFFFAVCLLFCFFNVDYGRQASQSRREIHCCRPPMGVMGSGILFVSRPVGLRRSVLAVVCDISWGSFWGNSKFMLGQQGFYQVYKRPIAVTIDKSPEMGTSSRPRSFLVARLAHVLPLPLFLRLYPSKGSGMASMCIIGIIVGLFIYGECCLVADVSRLCGLQPASFIGRHAPKNEAALS